MAITTVYYRHKTNRGWRYSAFGVGRRPEADKNGPFFIRVRDAANKYNWQKHETESAAKQAAERAPVTQIYLDAEMHDPQEQRKLDAAGRF